MSRLRERAKIAERTLRTIIAPLISDDWSHVTTFGTRYDLTTGAPYLLVGFDATTSDTVSKGIPSRVPDEPNGVPVKVTRGSRVTFGG